MYLQKHIKYIYIHMYIMYILHIDTYLQISNMHLCVNISDYEHIYLQANLTVVYIRLKHMYIFMHKRWWDAPPLMMPVANEGSLRSLLNI